MLYQEHDKILFRASIMRFQTIAVARKPIWKRESQHLYLHFRCIKTHIGWYKCYRRESKIVAPIAHYSLWTRVRRHFLFLCFCNSAHKLIARVSMRIFRRTVTNIFKFGIICISVELYLKVATLVKRSKLPINYHSLTSNQTEIFLVHRN